MIRTIYLFSFLLIHVLISAQNLVYNGGMEGIEKQQPCHWKSLAMQEQSATYQWYAPTEKLGKYVSKPYTPTRKQGDVQAMLMFRAENSAYMIVELKRPLLKGEEVTVELETIASYMQNGEALDEIGALLLPFSPTKAADLDVYKTNDILHLSSKTFPKLASRDRWMNVESNFIAKGGEQFLIIGNFKGTNFAMMSRNKLVGNWYQSSAATGNSKGWFGFIFDNVAVTSVAHQEADAAYNSMADCGYEVIAKSSNVSHQKTATPANKTTLQAKSIVQNPPSPSSNNANVALVNPTNSALPTSSKNNERGPNNTNPFSDNANMAFVSTPKSTLPASPKPAEKTVSSPSNTSTYRQSNVKENSMPINNAPISSLNAPASTSPKVENKTVYSSYTHIAPKVNMEAEIIFFDTHKANLSEKAFILLDNMAKKLAKNPKLVLQINGYANESKESTFAMVRANAVQAYLRSKGIDKNRLPIKLNGHSNISNYSSQSGKVDFIWIEK